DRDSRGERRGGEGRNGYSRLFINLGSVDDFTRGDLLGYICNNTGISGKSIGRIDMKGVFSFFEVEEDNAQKVIDGFKSVDFHGRSVRIEVSGEPSRGGGERRRSGGSGERRSGGGYGGGNRNGGGGFRDFSSGNRRREGAGAGERRSGG